jgi:hypothetical protein
VYESVIIRMAAELMSGLALLKSPNARLRKVELVICLPDG